MICRNCGNEMRDDARFCPSCGALNSPDMGGGLPQGAATYGGSPSWEGPEGGGKKKKTGLLIGAGVAAVAVIALAVFVVSGLLANPKGQVEKALAKSAAACAASEEKLGIPDVSQWQQDRSIAQRFALELRGINSDLVGYDMSALEGLGLRMNADYDGSGRKVSFDLGAYWGEDDLLSFRLAADDDEMYFHLPQFTGDVCYGVNTETLGHDLTEMTGDDSMDSLSFNLFDLVDMMTEQLDPEAMDQSLKEANKALWKAAGVKKTGTKTLDLNGTSAKTTLYHVTVPQEALEQYVDDLSEVMSAVNYVQLYEEMFQAMGMPEEELEDFLDQLEDMDVYGELAELLKDALDDFGDLELDLCLSGGYVSAVLYEGRIDGEDVSLALYLGGNGEYVDDTSLELRVNSTEISLKSTGDHSLKDGVYTDETTIQVRQLSTNVAKITSELSYDPSGKADNFQWELGVNSSGLSLFQLETAGALTTADDAVSLNLEDISLRSMGMELCDLAFRYEVSRNPSPWQGENARIITQMSQQELMAFANELQTNAEGWAEDMQTLFLTRLPEELLWAMMY